MSEANQDLSANSARELSGAALKGVNLTDNGERFFVLNPQKDHCATTAMFVYAACAGVDDMQDRRRIVLGGQTSPGFRAQGRTDTLPSEGINSLLETTAVKVGGEAAADLMRAVLKDVGENFGEPLALVIRSGHRKNSSG